MKARPNDGCWLFGVLGFLALMAVCFWGVVVGGLGEKVSQDSWSPRNYVLDRRGDCFVPPQGDPLYDAHYAQNVNSPNCEALVDQSTSKLLDAEASQVRAEASQIRADTTINVLGVYVLLGVVAILFLLFVAYLLRGSGTEIGKEIERNSNGR